MTASRLELDGAGNNHESAADRAEYLELLAAHTMVAASLNPNPGRPEGLSDDAYRDWIAHVSPQRTMSD